MKKIVQILNLPGLITLFCIIVSGCSNPLEEKVQVLELGYITWGCECANWATHEDMMRFGDNEYDSLAWYSIFIEPATPELELPDTLGWSMDVIRFTGSFHKRRGFPEGYKRFMPTDKARVFRYTSYEIIKSNHFESKRALDSMRLEEAREEAE